MISADFDKGVAAYKKGDFASASKERLLPSTVRGPECIIQRWEP